MQVATVTPVVTASNYAVAANATTFTFKGFGFDPIAAHDTVVFNDGAVGTVATANSTAMTVKFTTDPTTAGSLTAVVTIDDETSGAPVKVGTITPVVTSSTANLAASTPTRSRSAASASIRPPPITRSSSTTAPSAQSPRRPRPR